MHRSFGQGRASKEVAEPELALRPDHAKGSKMATKAKDNWRKWMWLLLGVIGALQLYFVRELLAAFALFALGFAGIAVCLASLYLAQKGWESGVARLAASQNSWVLAARRATAVSEELVRRPLRRPDSEPAH
jgi:hypothetical protein